MKLPKKVIIKYIACNQSFISLSYILNWGIKMCLKNKNPNTTKSYMYKKTKQNNNNNKGKHTHKKKQMLAFLHIS